MANWENLIQEVSDVIKPNNSQAITGQVLQNSLINIIESLGEGAVFKGVINSASAMPPESDGPCFCIYKNTGSGSIATLSKFGNIKVPGFTTVLLYTDDNTTWQYVELSRMAESIVYKSNVQESKISGSSVYSATVGVCTIGTGNLRVESQFGPSCPLIEINDRKVAIGTQAGDNKLLSIDASGFKSVTPLYNEPIISVLGAGSSLSIGTSNITATMGTKATVQIRSGIAIGPGMAPSTFENDSDVYLGPSAKIGTGVAIYIDSHSSSFIIKDLVSGKTTQLQLS